MAAAYLALWWAPPHIDEAKVRLEHRRQLGDTPGVFSFGSIYPASDGLAAQRQ